MKNIVAIYPGSFDPVTNGHLDLIHRGSKLFDKLIVAIARNLEKSETLFSMEERREMLVAMTSELENVSVDTFEGLLVNYCIQNNANAVLRGIRAISDYEFELQMALMNRKMEPRVETVFMMPAEQYSYLSSRIVREIAKLGGPLNGLVPSDGGRPAPRKNRTLPDRCLTQRISYKGQAMTAVGTQLSSFLTNRIQRIEVSATMAVAGEAEKLRATGVDLVDFGAGEPHYDTPAHIKEAAIAAIQNNFTKYTAVGGTAELRDAICEAARDGFRLRLQARRLHRLHRRQARVVQRDSGAGGPWRRGHSAGSLLGFVQRHRSLRRRRAGIHRDR